MRSLLIAMAMIAAAPAAHAADWPGPARSTTAPLLQLAQAQPDTINRNIPQQGGNVRPPRYVCIIKPPASDAGAGRYSCPASPGRVGESCRCANAVGSGKLRQY
ncbi:MULTISPECIES: hypothetical protein [Rhizobium/Agrobacterium group]|uniref:Uncharacterized protein n=2 Tax=Rhizobium/Agrobacterium group TaxID=227290 RepID=B9JSK6_ALLAM|nr:MULTISPECIES: hypothetical protein [Rhizobium/Agrobacterium group]ACM35699.1 hypothetical protein Avi_0989 [Allorhizobium ampelinum S4]MCF1447810.1 hypothetical protein [Allorhizobium ampelinum]MCF1493903.1 hypothetical protein [Allorhizobium ampelinum]MUO29356.1 hypothetical protein [Agrobacterium vitis]MUO42531.1 hypothetical protein [Agrobacterium vitis]